MHTYTDVLTRRHPFPYLGTRYHEAPVLRSMYNHVPEVSSSFCMFVPSNSFGFLCTAIICLMWTRRPGRKSFIHKGGTQTSTVLLALVPWVSMGWKGDGRYPFPLFPPKGWDPCFAKSPSFPPPNVRPYPIARTSFSCTTSQRAIHSILLLCPASFSWIRGLPMLAACC